MRTWIHRCTAIAFTLAVWSLLPTPSDSEQDIAADTVTVRYRGKTHTVTGKRAAAIRVAALELLRSSCQEIGGIYDDADLQDRYRRAKSRSHVFVVLALPMDVPRAGNNVQPVRVESMMIPFSPDLDPETVYVLPGKRGERAFTQFSPHSCDAIRATLEEAGIYPANKK